MSGAERKRRGMKRPVLPASFDSAAIRRSFERTYWTICENGVTPAIGSLANSQANATAPQQFAVDIDRAATHPLNDPGVLEVATGQPAEDHVAPGADVAHDSQDLGAELFELGADHDRASHPLHAGADLAHVPIRLGIGLARRAVLPDYFPVRPVRRA